MSEHGEGGVKGEDRSEVVNMNINMNCEKGLADDGLNLEGEATGGCKWNGGLTDIDFHLHFHFTYRRCNPST